MASEIDFVFPYVDCNDPIWQKNYKETRNKLDLPTEIKLERFREWDNLKYLFRGINEFMPWIRKVHMIASNPEQVPKWLNTNEVDIVLHKDIIPKEFLPTFNSTTIEMFINKIPDLADGIIYGNDDVFPIRPMKPSDFFINGLPKIRMKLDKGQNTQFKKVEFNCQKIIADYLGMELMNPNKQFFKVEHSLSPLSKKLVDKSIDIFGKILYNSCTEFRKEKNINQYFYTYYAFFTSRFEISNRTYIYRKLDNVRKSVKIANDIINQKADIICINDNSDFDKKYFTEAKNNINSAFEKILKEKSKFEKE